MTDANFRSHSPAGQRDDRASARRRNISKIAPSELRHVIVARRLFISAVASVFAGLAAAVLVVSLAAAGALPWIVGSVLALGVAGVIVLGIHVGGHGWLGPVPVVVLAAAWAGTISAGSWWSPVAWLLAAMAFLGALLVAALVLPAIAYRRYRLAGSPGGAAALPGSRTGVAVTAAGPDRSRPGPQRNLGSPICERSLARWRSCARHTSRGCAPSGVVRGRQHPRARRLGLGPTNSRRRKKD